jgi:hypothetical protein
MQRSAMPEAAERSLFKTADNILLNKSENYRKNIFHTGELVGKER